MKKMLFLVSSLYFILSLGGVVYADDSLNSGVDNVSNTSVVSSSDISESVATTSKESSSGTTTKKEVGIGVSSFNVTVNNDTCFTGLEQLLDIELPADFGAEKRLLLSTDLKSFLVELMSNGGYTLDTFKSKFVEILMNYGLEVSEDFLNAIEQYGSYYFNDDFEQEDNETILVWIGGTVGMMTTLFITSQMGGVHRGY